MGIRRSSTNLWPSIPFHRADGSIASRAVLEGRAVQVDDVQADPEYEFNERAKVGGLHTMLAFLSSVSVSRLA